MRRLPLSKRLAVIIALLIYGAGTAGASGPLPEVQQLRMRLFEIPYGWSGGTTPANVASVKLYVSRDRGLSWQEISTAKPEVQYFRYHAPADGEYWFATRTLDNAGQARPAGQLAAEQRIVVDTVNPNVLDFRAWITSPGHITARWSAFDLAIDPASAILQYRTSLNEPWKPAPSSGARSASDGLARGESTWQIDPSATSVWLQLTIRDAAGNGRQAGTRAEHGTPDRSAASSTANPRFASDSAPMTQPARQPRLSQVWPSDGSNVVPLGASRGQATNGTSGPRMLPAPNAASSLAQRTQPTPRDTSPSLQGSPFQFPREPSTTASASSLRRLPALGPPQQGSIFDRVEPTPPPASPNFPAIPPLAAPARNTQYLNNSSFEISYNLDNTPNPTPITRVELWVTRDDGANWQLLALDNDNRSPVHGVVSEPGKYGVKVIIEAVGTLPPIRPRPGDAPDMEVIVDTKPPIAQLTGVKQGEGHLADHLLVTWQASDEHLTTNPVTLSYSTQREGPWQTAATNLHNQGHFAWRLARHVPREFYLRLDVVDEAGNTTHHTTAVPVVVNLYSPTGRVNEIRALGSQ